MHPARARDSLTRGPARDDDILKYCTALRQGHVDWSNGEPIKFNAGVDKMTRGPAFVPVEIPPSWYSAAAEAAAASHSNCDVPRDVTQSNSSYVDAPPSRADLLTLVTRLQHQLTTAHEQHGHLSACLRAARDAIPAESLPTRERERHGSTRDTQNWEQQQAEWRRHYDEVRDGQRVEWTQLQQVATSSPSIVLARATVYAEDRMRELEQLSADHAAVAPAAKQEALEPPSAAASPRSAILAGRHRTRCVQPSVPAASNLTLGPKQSSVAASSREDSIARLHSELGAANAALKAAEVRVQEATMAQADAERAAAEAARSSSTASSAARAMREQISALRQELTKATATGRAMSETGSPLDSAELAGVKAQLRAKWEENEHLRVELGGVKSQLAQQEALSIKREVCRTSPLSPPPSGFFAPHS